MIQREAVRQNLRRNWKFRVVDNADPEGVSKAIDKSLYVAGTLRTKLDRGDTKIKPKTAKEILKVTITRGRVIRPKGILSSILIGLVVRLIVEYIFDRFFKDRLI